MGEQPLDVSATLVSRREQLHVPVMCDRVVCLLSPALREAGSIYVDGTLGMGGHAAAVLQNNPRARLIGIDRDADALGVAATNLASFADRVTLVQARFDELPAILSEHSIASVQAVLLDLGLSSLQIDRNQRGFSYSVDAPLDMRMDARQDMTAADIVNDYSEAELVTLLRGYGEERMAARIARGIVRARAGQPIVRSGQLVEIVSAAIPAAVKASGGHPAKRTFQALRIEVNGELDALHRVLPDALDALSVGGRMAVLAYHSLEDRPVKQVFAANCRDSAPVGLPVVPVELSATMSALTHGAERPNADEVAANPRAASARLRAVQRIQSGKVRR